MCKHIQWLALIITLEVGIINIRSLQLYLYVTLSRSERITLNTGIKAKAKNWNNKQKCFRSSEVGAPEKNAELKKLKAKLELAYMAHRDLTLEQLKIRLQEVIHPVIGRQKNIPTIFRSFRSVYARHGRCLLL